MSQSFDDADVKRIVAVIEGEPSVREALYQVLGFCRQRTTLANVIEYLDDACGSDALQDSFDYLLRLEFSGAISVEAMLDGQPLTAEEEAAYREGAFDRGAEVQEFCILTEAGAAAEASLHPWRRMALLLEAKPEYEDLFKGTLEFCSEPKSLQEIEHFLEQDDRVATLAQSKDRVWPAYFIDRLKNAGAIEWREGWVCADDQLIEKLAA